MKRNQRLTSGQIERDRRRQMFYQRQKKIAMERSGALFNIKFKMRRMAPFAFLIYASFFLFGFTYLFVNFKSNVVSKTDFSLAKGELGWIEIPKTNKIYTFNVTQIFGTTQAPLYSELEIEILDENYNHVYSVYKDLWQENYSNGEGRIVLYHDREINFEVELEKAGKYYIRGISYNDNMGDIVCSVNEKTSGSLYFGFYTIIFGILSVILVALKDNWGSPIMMYYELKRIRYLRKNRLFMNLSFIIATIYVGCLIISFTHYGYAAAGDKIKLPTKFYKTQKVIYLG